MSDSVSLGDPFVGPSGCQVSSASRPPLRSALAMSANVALGSPTNIAPMREITTSNDPSPKG
jgi:hypothetical protein